MILTLGISRGYAYPVAPQGVTGLGGLEKRRTTAPSSVRFFCVRSTAVPMGRLCVGSRKARRFLFPVRQPAYSLPTTLGGVVGGSNPQKRSLS